MLIVEQMEMPRTFKRLEEPMVLGVPVDDVKTSFRTNPVMTILVLAILVSVTVVSVVRPWQDHLPTTLESYRAALEGIPAELRASRGAPLDPQLRAAVEQSATLIEGVLNLRHPSRAHAQRLMECAQKLAPFNSDLSTYASLSNQQLFEVSLSRVTSVSISMAMQILADLFRSHGEEIAAQTLINVSKSPNFPPTNIPDEWQEVFNAGSQ